MKCSIKLHLLILIIFCITSCSKYKPSTESYKIIDNTDIERLTIILASVSDTISINNAKFILTDYLDAWNDTLNVFKKHVINIRKRSGYPIQPDSAYLKGLNDAKKDISSGKLQVKTAGLETVLEIKHLVFKSKWFPDRIYAYILKKDYSVTLDRIAGCQVDLPLKAYMSAYNRISKLVIIEFYGRDVFKESLDKINDTILKEGKYHKKDWQYTKSY